MKTINYENPKLVDLSTIASQGAECPMGSSASDGCTTTGTAAGFSCAADGATTTAGCSSHGIVASGGNCASHGYTASTGCFFGGNLGSCLDGGGFG